MNPATASIHTSEILLSKRRLAWAGAAAIGGCAAMCSLPMLAAVVLGGGAAATGLARFAVPGKELVVGGIAFVIALGVMAFRAKSRSTAKQARLAALQSEIPIACDPLVFSKDQRTAHHEMRGGAEGKALLADGFALLEGDQRAEMFLNPTGKITPEAFSAAKRAGGCGF